MMGLRKCLRFVYGLLLTLIHGGFRVRTWTCAPIRTAFPFLGNLFVHVFTLACFRVKTQPNPVDALSSRLHLLLHPAPTLPSGLLATDV